MEDLGAIIVIAGLIAILLFIGATVGAATTEIEMKQQIIDEHRAEWVVDQKGITSFRWK